jgi:hypothetical protein
MTTVTQTMTGTEGNLNIGALSAARQSVVGVAGKTGEVIQAYADALTLAFGTAWYELKGAAAKGVKGERALFKADMETAGFEKGTINVYWQRTKQAAGYQTTGNRVSGSETTDQKTLADLKTMINRIFKAESEGEDCDASNHKGTLIEVFEALGGNVDTIGANSKG